MLPSMPRQDYPGGERDGPHVRPGRTLALTNLHLTHHEKETSP
jgi:hypothetical protein